MVSSVNGAVCAVRSSFWGTTAHCAPRTPLKPTPALLTDPRIRAAYSEGAGIYRIVPMAVAVPRGVEELQEVVRWAGATGTSPATRGAGSGMAGGCVARGTARALPLGITRTGPD